MSIPNIENSNPVQSSTSLGGSKPPNRSSINNAITISDKISDAINSLMSLRSEEIIHRPISSLIKVTQEIGNELKQNTGPQTTRSINTPRFILPKELVQSTDKTETVKNQLFAISHFTPQQFGIKPPIEKTSGKVPVKKKRLGKKEHVLNAGGLTPKIIKHCPLIFNQPISGSNKRIAAQLGDLDIVDDQLKSSDLYELAAKFISDQTKTEIHPRDIKIRIQGLVKKNIPDEMVSFKNAYRIHVEYLKKSI